MKIKCLWCGRKKGEVVDGKNQYNEVKCGSGCTQKLKLFIHEKQNK